MLDINPGLLLFVAVLFLALIYLLDKMLYQPLLSFMHQRETTIQNDLHASREMGDEAEEARKAAHDTIAEAKSEAAQIREAAAAKAKEKAAAMIESVQQEIETQYASFAKHLEEERVTLKQSIESNLPRYQEAIQSKLKQIS